MNMPTVGCVGESIIGNDERGLYMSVTMPAIEVGTIGGGTSGAPQHACLD